MEDPIATQTFIIAPGIRETASEDGAVLLDIEQGICFSLNPVGLKIWELLKSNFSVDQITDALGQDFPIPREQLLSDTLEFVQTLQAKRLIRSPGQAIKQRSWLARKFAWARQTTVSQ